MPTAEDLTSTSTASCRRRRRALISSAILLAIAVIGGSVWFMSRSEAISFDAARISSSMAQPSTTTTEPPTELEVIRAAKTAVWRVETSGCGHEFSGTAWALDDRHLVTNGHVVDTDSNPTLRSPDGATLEATVIGRTMEPDLAVLQVDRALPHHLDWADTARLEEGQRLIALGFPTPGTEFATHPGTLVSFQVEGGTRVAIRTDAAVDRGNSGGPMITEKGEVAGVVTRMADNEGGFQNVPLAFTADSLRLQTDLMIAAPSTPEPDCSRAELIAGLPDESWNDWQVEPWEDWDLPEPEPYVPPTFPEYTTTTVPCPTGTPTAEITSVDYPSGVEDGGDRYSYDVTVTGRVTNTTSAPIYIYAVYVRFEAVNPTSLAYVDTHTLQPGKSSTFTVRDFLFDVDGGPGFVLVDNLDWEWDDWDHWDCPSQ